jgi:hypothetical protein
MKIELPQIIIIALFCMNIGIYMSKHGEQKEGRYNCWVILISVAIELGLLYWGGFFS